MIPSFRRLGLGLFPEQRGGGRSSEESEKDFAQNTVHEILNENGSSSTPHRSSILPPGRISNLPAYPKSCAVSIPRRNSYALELFEAACKDARDREEKDAKPRRSTPERTPGANEKDFPSEGDGHRYFEDEDRIRLVEARIFSDLRKETRARCYFLLIPRQMMLRESPGPSSSQVSTQYFQIRVLMVRLTDPSSVNAAVEWMLDDDEDKSEGCTVGLDCQPCNLDKAHPSTGTELNLIQLSMNRRCILIHLPVGEGKPVGQFSEGRGTSMVANPESLVKLLGSQDILKTGTMVELHSFAIFWATGMIVNGCKNVSDAHMLKGRPMSLFAIFRKLYRWEWHIRPDITKSDFGRPELAAWQIKYAVLNAWSSHTVALTGAAAVHGAVAKLSLDGIPPQILILFGRAIIDAKEDDGSSSQETSGVLTSTESGGLQLMQHDARNQLRHKDVVEVHLKENRGIRRFKVQSHRGKIAVLTPLDNQSRDERKRSGGGGGSLVRSSSNINVEDISSLTVVDLEKKNVRILRLKDALVNIIRDPKSCPEHLLLVLGVQGLQEERKSLRATPQRQILQERDLKSPLFREISSKLNDNQREAWRNILTSPLSATIGPPGTGKTSLISVVAKSCISGMEIENLNEVLVCTAYQNVAVRHIAETLQEAEIPGILLLVSEDHYSWHEESYSYLDKCVVVSSNGPIELSSSLAIWRARNNGMAHPYIVICTVDLVGRLAFTKCLMGRKAMGLIIDESSQAADLSVLHLLLSLPDLVMVSVLGDPHQLPPYAAMPNNQNKLSVFDLVAKSCKVNFLGEQYRMPDCICGFLSNEIYRKRLVTAPHRLKEKDATPLLWCHVKGNVTVAKGKTSPSNPTEAIAVVRFCVTLVKDKGIACEKIVVLTLYEEQNKMISSGLFKQGIQIPVHNVDSFQGQQCDIVLISLVVGRSFSQFAACPRRACVMLSRVRRLLCIYGDFDEVKRNTRAGLWCKLASLCKKQNFVADVDKVDGYLNDALEAVKRTGNPAPGKSIPEELIFTAAVEQEELPAGIVVQVLFRKR